MLILGFYDTFRHLENAEMTPELHDDLIHFSFDDLRDVFKLTYRSNLCIFATRFLSCLKTLVRHHFTYVFSIYLCIPRHSHYPTQIIFARLFKLASTGCFVRPLKNIILFLDSPSCWEITFTQSWYD